MEALDFLSSTSKCRKKLLFLLPLLFGERGEPSAGQLLRVQTLLQLAMKPGLEIGSFVEIPESAEPKLPCLHIARRDTDRNTVPALFIKAHISDSLLDSFVPLVEARIVGVNDYQ